MEKMEKDPKQLSQSLLPVEPSAPDGQSSPTSPIPSSNYSDYMKALPAAILAPELNIDYQQWEDAKANDGRLKLLIKELLTNATQHFQPEEIK